MNKTTVEDEVHRGEVGGRGERDRGEGEALEGDRRGGEEGDGIAEEQKKRKGYRELQR